LTHGMEQTFAATNQSLAQGIFDGMPLGYWFSGRDPKSHWGIRERYMTPLASPLDYSKSVFSVSDDGTLLVDERPVYSLHVHSKNLGYFDFENTDFLRAEAERVNHRKNRIHFSLSALKIFIQTNYRDFLMAIFSAAKWKALFRRNFLKK